MEFVPDDDHYEYARGFIDLFSRSLMKSQRGNEAPKVKAVYVRGGSACNAIMTWLP